MSRFVFGPLALLLLVGATAFSIDTITFAEPLIHPDTEENRRLVDGVLQRSTVLASRRYDDLFTVTYGATGGDFQIEAVISFDDGEPMGSFSMSREGDSTEQSFPMLGRFTEDKVSYLASAYASLWNAFTDGFKLKSPPVYVDELPLEIIAPLLVPTNPALVVSLAPLSGAPLSDGSLVVGMSIAAAKLDPWLRLTGRPGGDQVEANNYNLAGRVFTTPADTVYLIPSSGRNYYRVVDGVPGSRRQSIGNDVTTTPIAVLHDGSVVQKNLTTNDVERFEGRKRTSFSLATGQMSYVTLIATGPDGNLWAWDQVERRVKIFSPTGVLLDSVVAIHPADNFLSPTVLTPCPDGGFLLLVQGAGGLELKKFRRDGRPEWTLDEIASDFPESLPYNVYPVVGSTGSDIYLIDYLSKRVVKLFDRGAEPDAMLSAVLELNERILDNPDDAKRFADKAKFYEENNVPALAQATWKRLLEVDPYNSEANDAIERLEMETLKTLVRSQDRRARSILDSLGIESARYQYSTTIRSYEQILSLNPDDSGAAAQKRSLEELFIQRQAVPENRKKPITVAGVEIESIFPSLISYYRSNPVGTVSVENNLDEPIFDATARILIPKYMDLPSESATIEKIDAGDSAEMDLIVVLKDTVLTLDEDLQFPARIDIVYFTGEGSDRSEQTVTVYPGVTIHRKTALSWDDSGKLAAFIVPREQIVQRFAINITRGIDLAVPGIPDLVVRAATLCDAVGAHGIEYIEDPSSPFSEIFGKAEIIDTVRFPRDTLQYRIGDCDDTTALMASLLESVGVRTAIMTTPGHVFLAFDTGEPESNAWLFETDELQTISAKGNVWIPIESTTLSDGFYRVWRNASDLVRKYPGELEFLPTSDARLVYPAIPLPEATFSVVEPGADVVLRSVESSLENAADELYASAIGRYEERLASVSASRALRYLNQIGVLHARFGEYEKAASTLEDLVTKDPDYAAAYVNLSNVYMLLDEVDNAVELLRTGVEETEGSPVLSISLAQALYRLGERSEAADLYDQVAETNPDVAERFGYLGSTEIQTARAGVEPDAPLLWDAGEEE